MNKVILMGRLTRDPERLTAVLTGTATMPRRILSTVLHSAEAVSLRNAISVKESRLQLQDVSRQEAIQIKKA